MAHARFLSDDKLHKDLRGQDIKKLVDRGMPFRAMKTLDTKKVHMPVGTPTDPTLLDVESPSQKRVTPTDKEAETCKLRVPSHQVLDTTYEVDQSNVKQMITTLRTGKVVHPSEWRNIPACVVNTTDSILDRLT